MLYTVLVPAEASGTISIRGEVEYQLADHANPTTVFAAPDPAIVVIVPQQSNRPPVLLSVADQTVGEGSQLSFTASATDPDLPAQVLQFALDPGAPDGASITPNGLFTWTPSEAQGPSTNSITLRVSDGLASAAQAVQIVVTEVNLPPVLLSIADQMVPVASRLTFTAAAVDPDLPTQVLQFTLDPGAPEGASITPNGLFTWTPSEAQGHGTNTIVVRVSDGLSSAAQVVRITVTERVSNGDARPGDYPVGLLSWWKLSEVSNGTEPVARVDSGPAQADLIDGTTVPSIAPGYLDPVAAHFLDTPHNSIGDYLWLPNAQVPPLLKIDGPLESIAVVSWVFAESADSTDIIVSKYNPRGGAQSRGFALEIHQGGNASFYAGRGGTAGEVSSRTNAVSFGAWHHIAGVYDASAGELRIYVDGRLDGTEPYSGGIDLSQDDLYFGSNGQTDGADYYTGRLSDVALWNRALTASEIAALANAVTVQPILLTESTDTTQDIVLRWSLGTPPYDRLAQGFQATSNVRIESIRPVLGRLGNPAGNLWVTIEADAGGKPSDTAVSGGTSLPVSAVSVPAEAAFAPVRFVFSETPTVTAGVQYWMVLHAEYGTVVNENVRWRRSSAGVGAYPAGDHLVYDGTRWRAQEAQPTDFAFQVLGWLSH
jgi:hypothetical protein